MLRIKVLRFIKVIGRIGLTAFFSVRIKAIKVRVLRIMARKKGSEFQPIFCPKAGIHNRELKQTRTRRAPERSKFFTC